MIHLNLPRNELTDEWEKRMRTEWFVTGEQWFITAYTHTHTRTHDALVKLKNVVFTGWKIVFLIIPIDIFSEIHHFCSTRNAFLRTVDWLLTYFSTLSRSLSILPRAAVVVQLFFILVCIIVNVKIIMIDIQSVNFFTNCFYTMSPAATRSRIRICI